MNAAAPLDTASPLADLRRDIACRRVVVVVGAGVAVAATSGSPFQPFASWTGLLEHGIDRSAAFGNPPVPQGWTDRLRGDLSSGDLESLLSVAERVASRLGAPDGGEYCRWLEETVGSLTATAPAVLDALRDLGLPMATTNYDSLLEAATGQPAVTWRQGAQVEQVMRGDAIGILHLHGHWRDPESVVLGLRGYANHLSDPHAQANLRALRSTRTFLFVGCGAGLGDPNFGALLRWSREVFAGSPYRHYRLCLNGELDALRALHPPEERLFPLAYGADHADLAPFLRALATGLPSPLNLRDEVVLPAATSPAWPQFPPPPANCFGRDEAIEDLVAAICAEPPLPTPILGPPGVGKTTLSLEASHEPRVSRRFGARRFFVRCDGATSPDTLLATTAAALALEPGPGLEQRLFRDLSDSPAVLVLDNAETPWEADPLAVEDIFARLAALPGLALIASLRGEQRPGGPAWREAIRLRPLPLEQARCAFLAIAGERHAADPFLDRLLASVDGLPLAITLLAHEADALPSLDLLWQRWTDERSDLLQRAGGRTRDSSLAVSIAMSLESPRLTPAARRLASLLALLPDGAAADDLSHLCPSEAAGAAASLRKTGLAVPSAPRLLLLAPIREVLSRTLPPAAADRERLLAHYLNLADLGHKAGAEGGAEAALRLAPEIGNLEALIASALETSDPTPAIDATLALAELQRFTGLGGYSVIERALDAAGRHGLAALEAQLRYALGDLAFSRSDREAARAHYDKALSFFRSAGSFIGEATCIKRLGDVALGHSDHDGARSRYEEALPLFRRSDSLLGEANCIRSLGEIALERCDFDEAQVRCEEALPLFRCVGSLLGEAHCARSLGEIALERSDCDASRAHLEEALPLYRRAGDLSGEARCIHDLGDVALRSSEHDAARAYYQEALLLCRRVGSLLGEANCVQRLGDVALLDQQPCRGRELFAQALCLYERIPEPFSIGESHLRLARLEDDAFERLVHLQACRRNWLGIGRTDLIVDLDREFPDATSSVEEHRDHRS